jgi:hypothetical protein
LETVIQVPLEPCLGQLQYLQRRWHVQEMEPPSVRMHICLTWHKIDGHEVITE